MEFAKRSEDVSQRISQKLTSIIKSSKNILIAYCGATYGLVQHIVSILKISKPELALMAIDGDYTYNVVLPYIAESLDLAIVYSDAMHEKALLRLLHSILLNNIRSVFIIPNVVYEKHRVQWSREFENIDIIEIDSGIYRLASLLAALKIAIDIGDMVARINRIKSEVEVSSIVEEAANRYMDAIKLLKSCRNVIVSKSMIPLGEYLEEHNYNIYMISELLKELFKKSSHLHETFMLAYSSVEDHIVNEFIIEALRKGLKIDQLIDLRINTDPFTAPIYGILISMVALLESL